MESIRVAFAVIFNVYAERLVDTMQSVFQFFSLPFFLIFSFKFFFCVLVNPVLSSYIKRLCFFLKLTFHFI